MRIVFMGTPDFAVGVLEHLLLTEHEIVGVVTSVDKPAGRGKKINESAVKRFANANELYLLQPSNLKDKAFIKEVSLLKPDLIIVVAFRMLPKEIWQIPRYGTFNLHASLLPAYRGAAPINWAIINGENETGVTTFFIDDKIDTGAILLQKKIEIAHDETAGTLHDKLLQVGKILVEETIDGIENKTIIAKAQDQGMISKAPKLTKTNTKIDWEQCGQTIEYLIRGLSPYPTAWTYLMNKQSENDPLKIKIYNAYFKKDKHKENNGSILTSKSSLKVAVNDGWLYLTEIQYPGKRKMAVKEFLNGFSFVENSYFF